MLVLSPAWLSFGVQSLNRCSESQRSSNKWPRKNKWILENPIRILFYILPKRAICLVLLIDEPSDHLKLYSLVAWQRGEHFISRPTYNHIKADQQLLLCLWKPLGQKWWCWEPNLVCGHRLAAYLLPPVQTESMPAVNHQQLVNSMWK